MIDYGYMPTNIQIQFTGAEEERHLSMRYSCFSATSDMPVETVNAVNNNV